ALSAADIARAFAQKTQQSEARPQSAVRGASAPCRSSSMARHALAVPTSGQIVEVAVLRLEAQVAVALDDAVRRHLPVARSACSQLGRWWLAQCLGGAQASG